ncbi:Mitochondrial distribution and morphology protein 10 [Rhizoctonia solani]|uniref:Mitochondrial distribution and morphology protein 10 n=1 Tax=Rhizoctonia solani TaxID=456999 RepID=A0A8H7IN02_9AGAM|nr:Mitochondrial distribution and morphology protein 10 [Rhizoctonia solani]
MLDAALNKGNKPPIIADRIEVVELEMGKQVGTPHPRPAAFFNSHCQSPAPGTRDTGYRRPDGGPANPLNNKKSDFDGVLGTSRGILAAHQPLVVPMHLRLSHFRLNAYVVLVVSKQKGITLVFKTDPLQNVEVSSTFDSIAVIQKYIQREIEETKGADLELAICGRARADVPRASERPLRFPTVGLQPALSTYSLPTPAGLAALRPRLSVAPSMAGSGRGRQPSSSLNSPTTSSLPPLVPSPIDPPETPDSDIDQEHFDPTYGLRPEGLPSKSSYSGFSKLYVQNRGLGDLTDGTSSVSRPSSVQEESAYWEEDSPDLSDGHDEPGDEYETIPAVGGGTITRPKATGSVALPPKPAKSLLSPFQSESGRGRKMYSNHQSPLKQWVGHQEALRRQMGLGQAGSVSLPTTPPPRAPLSRAGSNIRYEPQHQHQHQHQQHQHQHERRRGASSYFGSSAPTGSRSSVAGRTISTPPSSELPASGGEEPALNRKRSLSPSMVSPTYSREVMHYNNDDPNVVDPEPEIVLRPGLNTTVTQLSALSQTNHTLSFFAPSVQGVTVRSVPRRPGGSVSATPHAERVPVKARRKRVYRVGKKKEDPSEQGSQVPLSPTTSQSEYGHYFRHPESLYARTDDERF